MAPDVRASSPGQREGAMETISLQLGVLRLGLLQDGNVGVGVFPCHVVGLDDGGHSS